MVRTEIVSERAGYLLKFLVERYIRDGQPVGSATLAQDIPVKFSPATIRNVMADLEARGFIASPHTSSGRIPTQQGYRFFVDSLVTAQKVDEAFYDALECSFQADQPRENLVEAACTLVSHFTQCAGIVTLPHAQSSLLRHIEFLPLDQKRVLAVIVVNGREVQNRLIEVSRAYTENELLTLSNYINQNFAGMELHDIQKTLVATLERDLETLNQQLSSALEVAKHAFSMDKSRPDYVLHGANQLFQVAEELGLQDLQKLFTAFTEKEQILHLLTQTISANRVQVFIGEEAGLAAFENCSVISAPYSVDGRRVGVLGVIGPTRIRYDRVIPIVELTANMLGFALHSAF